MMRYQKRLLSLVICFTILTYCSNEALQWSDSWECEIYPPEHVTIQDPTTGAKVTFITTDSSQDINFYFDLNCWFADHSLMAFFSDRAGRAELFGYLPETGEIVRLQSATQAPAGNATVDYQTHDIYAVRENTIYQWHADISASPRTSVRIQERKIATAPARTLYFMGLTESADGKFLSAGLKYLDEERLDIVSIDIQSGAIKTLLTRKSNISHVQFSKYNPNLLRFSYTPQRMWYIDVRKPGVAYPIHRQEPGELVTHEDWWVNDQMTFCGGYRPEESHLKIVDIHTQQTRIIGAGSWWEEGTPVELSKYNWWHASGSRDGRWVVTDNWHGHIAVSDIRTSHLRLLTVGHRPYGDVRVEHPHPGWAPDSKSVEFTSHQRGNPDVCIAYLPEEWDDPFMKE